MALLELRGVTKKFGGLVAVNNFDMDVNEGEIRGLIGPNGAGKTTAFNIITGYYPATRGQIRYKEDDITHLKTHEITKRGLVRTFQLSSLFMELTVLKGVITAQHLHAGLTTIQRAFGTAGSRERENEAKSLEIIEFLGLGDFKYELACNLPHGHQRALGIGLALATEPKLLLLDEPVTGMNVLETEHMMGVIRRVRDSGVTILLVEHDMKAVMGLADKITVMNFGEKIAEGLPEKIADNKLVIEAYLGREELVI